MYGKPQNFLESLTIFQQGYSQSRQDYMLLENNKKVKQQVLWFKYNVSKGK